MLLGFRPGTGAEDRFDDNLIFPQSWQSYNYKSDLKDEFNRFSDPDKICSGL